MKSPRPIHHQDYARLSRSLRRFSACKLGYPESMLSRTSGLHEVDSVSIDHEGPERLVDNRVLGIEPDSLAEALVLNVGSPWKESETFSMEAKQFEREVLEITGRLFGLAEGESRGYVTSGGTEANLACLWWNRHWLISQNRHRTASLESELEVIRTSLDRRRPDMSELESFRSQLASVTIQNKLRETREPVVYFSEGHTHYSIKKLCDLMGLRSIPVASNHLGQIDCDSFDRAVSAHAELRPHQPILLVANAGTTVTGAIDNLPRLKNILEQRTARGQLTPFAVHCDAALYGLALPVTQVFGPISNHFEALGIRTMSISGHKLLGTSVCGIALTTLSFLDGAFVPGRNMVGYCGNIEDVTITGCRSGLNVLLLHNTLKSLSLDRSISKLKNIVDYNLAMAVELYKGLTKLLGEQRVQWIPQQFNILFPKPSPELMQKYSLMPTSDERCVACVLSNVNPELIREFLVDYGQDRARSGHLRAAVEWR